MLGIVRSGPWKLHWNLLYPDPSLFLSAANKIEEMAYTKIARSRAITVTSEGYQPLNSSTVEVIHDGTQIVTGYFEGESAPLATVITCSEGQAITTISDLPADHSTEIKRWPMRAEISAQCVNPKGYAVLSLTN